MECSRGSAWVGRVEAWWFSLGPHRILSDLLGVLSLDLSKLLLHQLDCVLTSVADWIMMNPPDHAFRYSVSGQSNTS